MLILKCVFRLVITEHLFESGVVFSLVAQVLMDVHIVSLKIQYASGNIRAVVGNQAAYQIAATIVCFPNLKKVYVADLLFPENAENFVAGIQASLQDELGIDASGISFEATNKPDETVPQSDIIITVTSSRQPVIKKERIRPGMHFSTVGSNMEGKEELDLAEEKNLGTVVEL